MAIVAMANTIVQTLPGVAPDTIDVATRLAAQVQDGSDTSTQNDRRAGGVKGGEAAEVHRLRAP